MLYRLTTNGPMVVIINDTVLVLPSFSLIPLSISKSRLLISRSIVGVFMCPCNCSETKKTLVH